MSHDGVGAEATIVGDARQGMAEGKIGEIRANAVGPSGGDVRNGEERTDASRSSGATGGGRRIFPRGNDTLVETLRSADSNRLRVLGISEEQRQKVLHASAWASGVSFSVIENAEERIADMFSPFLAFSMKFWVKILICVPLIVLLGGLGAVVTTPAIKGWYSTLEKPPGVPPNAVFGPVWTALYSMMGISLALIWHRVEPGAQKKRALGLFLGQLILNLAWSPVFFGLHWMGVALIIIAALLLLLPYSIIKIRSADKLAGRLLIPYTIWVGYATYLNAGYWWLNR